MTSTLGEVMDQVVTMSANCHDSLVPVDQISFESLDTLRIDGACYGMRPLAQRGIANRLKVPHLYLSRCPAELQARQLQYWLEHEPNRELFFRFDGRDVRALFTPRYKPVDNIAVLDSLEQNGYGLDMDVEVSLDKNFMSLGLPNRNSELVVSSDRLQSGVSISNSEVGLSCFSVMAYFLRLACTNGLIITGKRMAGSFRHVSEKVLEHMPELLANASQGSQVTQERIQISMDSPVDDPQATMKAFNRQFQLGEMETEGAQWGWDQGDGDQNMWGIVNAYTKGAAYPALPAESSHRLQKVGGEILGMVN
jgi:hypothetical protein